MRERTAAAATFAFLLLPKRLHRLPLYRNKALYRYLGLGLGLDKAINKGIKKSPLDLISLEKEGRWV